MIKSFVWGWVFAITYSLVIRKGFDVEPDNFANWGVCALIVTTTVCILESLAK